MIKILLSGKSVILAGYKNIAKILSPKRILDESKQTCLLAFFRGSFAYQQSSRPVGFVNLSCQSQLSRVEVPDLRIPTQSSSFPSPVTSLLFGQCC